MKKRSTIYYIVASLLVLCSIYVFSSCGSSTDGSNSIDRPNTQIQEIVQAENKQADQFVSKTILYADSVNQLFDEIETKTLGMDLEGMTVDDLVYIFGKEEVDSLAQTIVSLFDEKINPASESMNEAQANLALYEQQFQDMLEGTSASSQFAAVGLITAGAVCVAATVLVAGAGTIAYCTTEVRKENNACIADRMSKGESRNVATLACTLQLSVSFKKCLKDIAFTVYTTAVGASSPKFRKFKLINKTSKARGKIKKLIGQKGCGSNQNWGGQIEAENARSIAGSFNPDGTLFVGTGEDNTFLVPEGDWTFMMVADGYARSITGCMNISGPDETIQQEVQMVPDDEVDDLLKDNDGDGYTICQNDCDDNDSSAYPGSNEICSDSVDNDCDGEIDSADAECFGNDAEECPMTYQFTYVPNIVCIHGQCIPHGIILEPGDNKWIICEYQHELSANLRTETPYENGQIHGVATSYYENGQLQGEAPYTNGSLDGVVRYYYENGQVESETPYRNDLKHGEDRSYYDNGVLKYCYMFENDTYVGDCS